MRTLLFILLAGQLGAATNLLNPPIPAQPVYTTYTPAVSVSGGVSGISTTASLATGANYIGTVGITTTPAVNLSQIGQAATTTYSATALSGKMPIALSSGQTGIPIGAIPASGLGLATSQNLLSVASVNHAFNGTSNTAIGATYITATTRNSLDVSVYNFGGAAATNYFDKITSGVKVIPSDTAGNAFESVVGVTGDKYMGVAAIQDVHASTLNASTAALASTASFTGTAESTLGVAGIQVSCFSNETITVRVQQSANGTQWWWEDSFTSFANTGESRTFQATSNYYRVIANNTGAATTQTFTVQVALCPVVEALPRSLTADGALKINMQSFKSRSDKVIVSITTTAVAPVIVIPAQGDRIYTDLSSIHLSNQSNAATVVRVYDGAANTVIAFNMAAGADKDIVWGTALVPQSLPNQPWSIQTTVTPGGAGGLFRATMYGYKVKQ